MHHHLLLALALLLLLPPASASRCPISGALLPPAQSATTSAHIQSAQQQLTAQLDLALSGNMDIVGGWQTNATSFSIVLTGRGGVLWEYHHHHAGSGGGGVTGDTQFRVASVTKVVTDLVLLKLQLDRDDAVTKYLPELAGAGAGSESAIAWDEVTLGSLGDHMAGIPGACKCRVVSLRG